LIVKGILPLIGGLALLGAFILSIKSYWPASSSYSSFAGIGGIFLIGAGSLLIGVLLMLLARFTMPQFFTRGTLPPLATTRAVVESAVAFHALDQPGAATQAQATGQEQQV